MMISYSDFGVVFSSRGIAINVRCGFNERSGSGKKVSTLPLTQAAAAAATKKATDGMLGPSSVCFGWFRS